MMKTNILRQFWNTRMGKAQIISEATWMFAVVIAIQLRNLEALTLLPIAGAGILIFFANIAFNDLLKEEKK